MFKSLSTDALGISGSPSEIIELALSYGFKGLELDIVEFAAQVKAAGMAKARRLYDSSKLRFASFRLPVEWHEDPDRLKSDLANLPSYLEIAKELGCQRAITFIEPAGDMRPFHENFEYHRRKLAELAGALEPYQIRLGVEFLAPASYKQNRAFQFIQSVDQYLLLLKSVGAKNVGLALDTWHWHLGGGTIEQLRSFSADRIIAVRLSDCDAGVTAADATEKSRRLPGETGVIDNVAVLTALGELRCDCPIAPAQSKDNLAGQSRDKIVKAAGTAIDQIWKASGLNSQGKLLAAAK